MMNEQSRSDMTPPPPMSPDAYAAIAERIELEVGRVIVGQRELVRSVLTCLLAEGHVLLEGIPGVGKTMLLKTLSLVVDLPFSRIQFTPDLMPADIIGTQVLEEDEHGHRSFTFRSGPVFASFLLADEINRASPKTQSALLEAMQERAVTAGGSTRNLPRPFLVMATQNPLEMEGTYPLPEAQLDRFLLKALVPFPSADDLVTVLERTTGSASAARQPRRRRPDAAIDDRPDPAASRSPATCCATPSTSSSPPSRAHRGTRRAWRATCASAPRRAAPRRWCWRPRCAPCSTGDPNVAVDDIRAVAPAALRHRLVVGYEAVADGVTTDVLIDQLLHAVPAPGAGVRGAG